MDKEQLQKDVDFWSHRQIKPTRRLKNKSCDFPSAHAQLTLAETAIALLAVKAKDRHA